MSDTTILDGVTVDSEGNVSAGQNFFEQIKGWLGLKQADCKTEGGVCYPASDFAYVPDKSKSSTWKLRMAQDKPGNVTRSQLGKAAAAFSPGGFRGQKVKIPQGDVSKVKAKIRAAYTKLGVKREDMPPSIKEAGNQIHFLKDADTGKYKCVLAYSNNFRDNDNPPEIITAQSHLDFNKALADGEWPMPDLYLWHEEYPVGQVDFHTYDEKSGFSVAAATFDKEWAAEALIKSEWDALSHGMPTVEIVRDKEDDSLIVRHRTKEISFLPRWAAANKLTFHSISSKETNMTDVKGLGDKRPHFVSLIGETKTAELEESLLDKSEEAKESGTEQKEADVPEDQQPVSRKELLEALTYVLDEVKALKEEKATKQEDEPQDLVAMLKAHSAVGDESARVDGRTKAAKDAPAETEAEATGPPSVYGVPLLDKLLSNKQAYAAKQQLNLGNLPPEILAAMTEAQ